MRARHHTRVGCMQKCTTMEAVEIKQPEVMLNLEAVSETGGVGVAYLLMVQVSMFLECNRHSCLLLSHLCLVFAFCCTGTVPMHAPVHGCSRLQLSHQPLRSAAGNVHL